MKKTRIELAAAAPDVTLQNEDTIEVDAEYNPHWEGLSDSDDWVDEDDDLSEPEDNIEDPNGVFDILVKSSQSGNETTFRYQRKPELTDRQQRRQRANARELSVVASAHSQSIEHMFNRIHAKNGQSNPLSKRVVSSDEATSNDVATSRNDAIRDLETTLKENKCLKGVNLVRHQAVLALLYVTRSRRNKESKDDLAMHVARSYNRGKYFANRVRRWEKQWTSERKIEGSKRGQHSKSNSWFNDEGVQLAIRDYVSTTKQRKLYSKPRYQFVSSLIVV